MKKKAKIARLSHSKNNFQSNGGQVNLKQNNSQSYEVITEEILRPMERGQITLPAKIRKSLGINAKTWLKVSEMSNKKIIIEAVDVSESRNSNVIPAKRPFAEVMEELKNWKGRSFTWTEEDDRNLKKVKELSLKKLRKLHGIK